MKRLTLGILAAAVLALPIAGCGGDDTETYRREYTKAAREFKESVEQAGRKIPGATTLKDRLPALRSYKASTDKLAKDLDGLDPPENVEKLNDEAVAALRTLSADLGRLEQATSAGDARAVKELAPELQMDQAMLAEVLDKIDQKIGAS
jgi:hypothetical protein